MSVKVTDNTPMVDFSVKRGAALAVRNMLEATHTEARPKTPRDTGDLKDNVTKAVHGTTGTITWQQPYAIYQESKQHQNYTTPGTGSRFAENAVKKIVAKSGQFFSQAMQIAAKPRSRR